jgi:hypothetical protein
MVEANLLAPNTATEVFVDQLRAGAPGFASVGSTAPR